MSKLILAASLCISFFAAGALGQQQSDGPLTNASIVRLVKAGFKEKTIITIIGNRPGDFKLDTEHLIELKRSGVNENIILAMLSSQMGIVLVEDEWSATRYLKTRRRVMRKDRAARASSVPDRARSRRVVPTARPLVIRTTGT